jgi:hypothetical protein
MGAKGGARERRIFEPEQVEKRKVEEMHFEISLPRMPGREHENLRTLHAGHPHPALGGDTLGSRSFSSLDERSTLDGDQFT